VGKRSGSGVVAHKATLVSALSRALSERVMLLDFTIGRRGLLGYLKALAGSNIVKIAPASESASEAQTSGQKRLRVTCGSHTSYLEDSAWIGDNTPMTLCEVRISPNRVVKPNIGGLELAEALNRVLPFTAKEDNRPVLQCILFRAREGKLTLVSADGFRLAVVTLDYDSEGEALILRDDLKGIANVLRKAHRVALSFEASGDSLDGTNLVIDTEITRYKWLGTDGTFPDYEKLIPAEAKVTAHLDTVEAVKAIASLKVLADSKSYPIDLHLDGGIVMTTPDDRGEAKIPADIEGGEVKVRIDGAYLIEAMRAYGSMVDFKVIDGKSPVLFTVDGYQLVVMPMLTTDSKPKAEVEEKPQETKATETAEQVEKTEAIAEAEAVVKAETCGEPIKTKPNRSRKKEPVTAT
jgi:DNA polymerase-3 subunit beta